MAHPGDSLPATAESDGFVTMYLIKRGDFVATTFLWNTQIVTRHVICV
jgi:hypothetical protein